MGGSSKKVTVGYKYYLGAHLILCHGPVDKITRIEVDGKTAWSGNATGGPISINAPNLFGGEGREGGVSGTVDIEMGRPNQGRNAYLQGRLGSDIPAYRGVVGAVLRQVYVGLNPYLKRWAFWASRIHTRQNGQPQWYDEKAEINGDMNPAHIIRECLTDRDWGMGYPETDIDDASFRAAADLMHAEGMGMSLLWDRSTSLEDFLKEVLKHIDGSLYVDRVTGKFTLKLARGGYDINNLLILDENSIERITDFQRTAPGDLVNSVTVVYWDANTGKNNSVTVQDIALTAQQQAVVGTTLQYPGFTRGDIATRVASRELTALSTPLASATIYANRKAASLNIGDVFVLSWPRYGITRMVMRVANIELGSLDKNAVKIQAVEDVFALPQAVYAPPPPSAWENPVTAPTPCPHHSVVEAPYWELVQRMGETEAAAVPPTSGHVVATGTRPSGSATNARLYTNPTNTAWEDAGAVDFCPYARLAVAATPTATVLAIDSGIDLDLVQPGTYAIIDNEIVRVDAVTDTTLTVGRGVLDTVAAPHAVGAHILFTDAYCETDAVEYATGETARIRLLPVTGMGTLDVSAAPTQTVTIAGRHAKPYPPGRLRINNQAYPAVITGPLSLSWAHRDRLQQTATLISEEAGSIGPEPGTTYNLRLYGETGSLLRTETGLTGTSYTWTNEEQDSGLGSFVYDIMEDFEDDSYAFDFLFSGNANWERVGTNPYNGSFCLKSGAILDNQTTSVETTVSVGPQRVIRFAYRVSSESGYDFFRFYLDGVEKLNSSGTVGWTVFEIAISEGAHTLKWTYSKDGSVSAGEDAAYIDDLAVAYKTLRLNGHVRCELESLRDGLTSYQKHDISVDRAGYGYNWGKYYGGV